MDAEFHNSRLVATLGLSTFVIGIALGPMLLSPLSEFYGRRPIYLASWAMFVVWIVPSAVARNIATMIVARFFDGLAGSAFLSVAGGTVGDMFARRDLQAPMMAFSMAPFIGPSLGPLIGGFINYFAAWRWTYYVLLIWSFVLGLAIVFLVPETYREFPHILVTTLEHTYGLAVCQGCAGMYGRGMRDVSKTKTSPAYTKPTPRELHPGKRHQANPPDPVLLRNKARALRAETKDDRYKAPMEKTKKSISKTLAISLLRPFQLLIYEPMCLNLCIYSAILLGILYLFFGAFPLVFATNHGFNLWQVGLTFMGIFCGMIVSAASDPLWHRIRDRLMARLAAETGDEGASEPEFRLPPAILGSVLVSIGMFWFAWTTFPTVHWIVPIIGSAVFGAG